MRVTNGLGYEDHHIIWLKCGENARLMELLHNVVDGRAQSDEAIKLARELWPLVSNSVEVES